MTAVATSNEVGGEGHALNGLGRRHVKIAVVAGDRMLTKFDVRDDERLKRGDSQAELKTSR